MPDVPTRVAEAASAIRDRWPHVPRVGVVLGSGHAAVVERISEPVTVDYAGVPHFAGTTAIGHRGRLVCGELAGASVVVLEGRSHLYEGNDPASVTLAIRVIAELGADVLIATNAAGGLDPQYKVGDLMVIDDHINFMFRNPLVGPADPRLGARWPDMSSPYDRELGERARCIAGSGGFQCHRGVYVGMLGPTYETRAEYRMLRRLGGDAVGMSTVPEVIVAVERGMRVVGLSTITNVCSPDRLGTTSGAQVVEAASGATAKLAALVEGLIRTIQTTP